MLTNKVFKLEDKMKNLEVQNNNLDKYNSRSSVEVFDIPIFVHENFENTVINIFNAIDVKISKSHIETCYLFGIEQKMLFFNLQIGNV